MYNHNHKTYNATYFEYVYKEFFEIFVSEQSFSLNQFGEQFPNTLYENLKTIHITIITIKANWIDIKELMINN